MLHFTLGPSLQINPIHWMWNSSWQTLSGSVHKKINMKTSRWGHSEFMNPFLWLWNRLCHYSLTCEKRRIPVDQSGGLFQAPNPFKRSGDADVWGRHQRWQHLRSNFKRKAQERHCYPPTPRWRPSSLSLFCLQLSSWPRMPSKS